MGVPFSIGEVNLRGRKIEGIIAQLLRQTVTKSQDHFVGQRESISRTISCAHRTASDIAATVHRAMV
jgi:hypothetical protein